MPLVVLATKGNLRALDLGLTCVTSCRRKWPDGRQSESCILQIVWGMKTSVAPVNSTTTWAIPRGKFGVAFDGGTHHERPNASS